MTVQKERAPILSDRLMGVIQTQTEIAKLGLDLGGVMSFVAERAQMLTAADGAVVELAEQDDMVYRASTGIAEGQLGLRLKRVGSLSGLCVKEGKPLRCDNADEDARVDREACQRVGLLSMLVFPLQHQETVVGVLKVVSKRATAFGDQDLLILELMSGLIAAAMFHATQYHSNELFQRATQDALTGLPNRALFFDRLRHSLPQARRNRQRVGVLYIDMDGLKQINDELGHRAGDAALRELGQRIVGALRQADTAARLGGDEFAVIMAKVSNSEGASLVAKRLTERIEQPFRFEGRELRLAASVGIALFPDDSEELEPLLETADRNMYVSKRDRKQQSLVNQPVKLIL
jgi:diguanylate cyclase (GGDEF)-like protein